jgi:hypothetical protein
VVTCDLNNDARPDLLVTQNNDRLLAFRNGDPGGSPNAFLAVRLAGTAGNLAGTGARVTVELADGATQTQEVYSGSGYLSQSSSWLFFGRGEAPGPAQLHVHWPDGNGTVHSVDPQTTRLTIEHPASQ